MEHIENVIKATGLFEFDPVTNLSTIYLSRYKLKDHELYLFIFYLRRGKVMEDLEGLEWRKECPIRGHLVESTFEEVLESVNEETQIKLLYHLDLFRGMK